MNLEEVIRLIMSKINEISKNQNKISNTVKKLEKKIEKIESSGIKPGNDINDKKQISGSKNSKLKRLINIAKCSVIKIEVSGTIESHVIPGKKQPFRASGTGFIVEHNGEKKIITNSHVISNATDIKVRLVNESKRYSATIKRNGTKCDLARIEVEDKEFWNKVKPLQIDEKYELGTGVTVLGFPTGGDNLSVTTGEISRNDAGPYAHSGEIFKEIQIDAAINPGNSGGPVVEERNGKIYVLGVAHQGLKDSQNIGYMIRSDILKHFLKDDASKEYKGFPDFYIDWQEMNNKYQRKDVFGLKDNQSGILVTKIPKLSAANGILKENDVITKINGISVTNKGKIKDPKTKANVDFIAQIRDFYVGETVKFTIVRDKKEMDVDLKLKNSVGQLNLATEQHAAPTYYMNANLVFSVLSSSFVKETRGLLPSFLANKLEALKKDNYNEQAVIISDVVPSKFSKGFESSKYNVVNEINGMKINNIEDVIKAMESNTGKYHTIKISSHTQKIIHMKVLNDKKDYISMLKNSGRMRHCSPDLKDKTQLLKKISKDKTNSEDIKNILFDLKSKNNRLDRLDKELKRKRDEFDKERDSFDEDYDSNKKMKM